MLERDVSVKRVVEATETGETVEDYSAEMPEPSRLILGFQGKRAFHVVAVQNPDTQDTTIITVYIPDPGKWEKGFKRRRS
jgi:hypothetical protein